ncbi:P-loop containing nucleoside triphosphate hydrolase protein [Paraphysoderma sedebokerense]|nr:P-loop containing nucleoside triphosphate hydrolase protein [Paraphysoderma sedebokerense]
MFLSYIIASTQQYAIITVWPSTSVATSQIQTQPTILETISVPLGHFVTILPILDAPVDVLSVTFRWTTEDAMTASLQSDPLLEYLVKEVLVEVKYISINRVFDFNYRDRSWSVTVDGIDEISSKSLSLDCRYPVFRITRRTSVQFRQSGAATEPDNLTPLPLIPIGGLESQLSTIRSIATTALYSPHFYTQYNLPPPKGILLYGPPGTGKTLLAKVIASELKCNVVIINGSEIMSKYYGETENTLRSIFEKAEKEGPSILFIDEIDALCPKRDDTPSEMEKRIVATLLTLMDGTSSKLVPSTSDLSNPHTSANAKPNILILASTNRPSSLDPALRRPGRFDVELEIPIPTLNSRIEILTALLSHTPHTLSNEQITSIAEKCHGFVGADLSGVVKEAGISAVRKFVKGREAKGNGNDDVMDLKITVEDFKAALGMVKPSAMREVQIEVPKVYWNDIGGQEEIKQKLKESVEWPLKHADLFTRFSIRPPKGILLYGPPGCSKTLMAKALATEAGLNFIAIKGPELFNKYVGESEKKVREVFRKARAVSPSIVFFDEIDAVAVKRSSSSDSGNSVGDRVLSQLLNELDGIESLVNVTVVAATNRPDVLDPALLRPGRIDRLLYIPPPTYASRLSILKIQTSRMSVSNSVTSAFLESLASLTEGYSGAEMVSICQIAAMSAMEEDVNIKEICKRHFEAAFGKVKKRITKEMIEFYERFRDGIPNS